MSTQRIKIRNTHAGIAGAGFGRLFIPLKREYFEAFERGEKTEEYRPHGPRWNAQTCKIGRRVTLSLGYGKARLLNGTVVGFRIDHAPEWIPGWRECYGLENNANAACIAIKLDVPNVPDQPRP